ncbi:MAG: hypothetical protein WC816_05455 [Sphingomonas sp.]|jgi:hypothetical protein
MAYLAFAQRGSDGLEFAPALIPARPGEIEAGFSTLEWSIISLARQERLSSLREPGRLTKAFHALFGGAPATPLANPRLEALRRIAVLSWHRGYTIESYEVRAFYAAGYTASHYELLVNTVIVRREADRNRSAR